MNNLIYIIMDSCRYDTCLKARTPNMDRLGEIERRYAYASWTSPSHYALLMGLTPHKNPPGVFASEVYKEDFLAWRRRLNAPGLDFQSFVPQLSLPHKLKEMGYRTVAKVSLPVLNRFTSMSLYFDDYKLMADHNDFAGMIEEMTFDEKRPGFYFLNLGETHYPYMLSPGEAPVLHGVHGVFKCLDDEGPTGRVDDLDRFFRQEEMERLRNQQVKACEHIDGLLGRLFERCPEETYFIITADHGELFGEDGYFGHGPIFHPKVFEVPFMEGVGRQ
jgi:arylsulfatase A-like enzyme